MNLAHVKIDIYKKFERQLEKVKGEFGEMLSIIIEADTAIHLEHKMQVDEVVADMFEGFHRQLLLQYTELLNRTCGYIEKEFNEDNEDNENAIEER